MTHSWKAHAGFTPPKDISADTAAGELERIRLENDGRLSASDVVETSRAKTAVLHTIFEWRDKVAAEEHRLAQARHVIRAVRVVREDGADTTPAFVNVASAAPAPSYYQSASEAVADPEEWEKVVFALARRLNEAKRSLDDVNRIASERGLDKQAALVVIAKAFALVESTLAELRH